MRSSRSDSRRLWALVGALLITMVFAAATVDAAPPYDVTVQFDAPVVDATHGPVEGYRLYQGCRSGETKTAIGEATSGQTFTGLLTADGEYSFCVHAFNSTGEGPRSSVQVLTFDDFEPAPGAPLNFQITLTCDASCSVNISSE